MPKIIILLIMTIICIVIWGILGMFFTNIEVHTIPDPEGLQLREAILIKKFYYFPGIAVSY